VLVVDDFSSNLLVIEGMLSFYGIRVRTCRSGGEAVELVRENSFDLVFMDHMMPEMDGMEATRIIRSMSGERFRTLPVVALTANVVSGMREMFLENGFTDFLAKPIKTAELDAVLKKRLPADKLRAGPEETDARPEAAVPEIAGVDAALGLARVGGSRDLYLEVLAAFRTDAEACLARIAEEPGGTTSHTTQSPDPSLRVFITHVHAMKSALANIGAEGLSGEAALLEKAGREADVSLIRARLPAFREELAALAARVDAALAPDGEHAADDAQDLDPADAEHREAR
jgi:CheY-like chemotaxis protein